MPANLKSPLVLTKVVIFVFGIIVVGLGVYSHFRSGWKRLNGHHICDIVDDSRPTYSLNFPACPSIALEQYFVAIIIICFIMSLISLAMTFTLDTDKIKVLDMGFHAVSAILLFIAGIMYIVSAVQISNIVDFIKMYSNNIVPPSLYSLKDFLLTSEKLTAGALAVIQAFVYLIAAVLTMQATHKAEVFTLKLPTRK